MYLLLNSKPIYLLFSLSATFNVVPVPANGSKTKSSSFVVNNIQFSTNLSGKVPGCILLLTWCYIPYIFYSI